MYRSHFRQDEQFLFLSYIIAFSFSSSPPPPPTHNRSVPFDWKTSPICLCAYNTFCMWPFWISLLCVIIFTDKRLPISCLVNSKLSDLQRVEADAKSNERDYLQQHSSRRQSYIQMDIYVSLLLFYARSTGPLCSIYTICAVVYILYTLYKNLFSLSRLAWKRGVWLSWWFSHALILGSPPYSHLFW